MTVVLISPILMIWFLINNHQQKKTFIISTLLFLSGLFYLALAAANLLSFTALPFYAPIKSPLYLLIIGIASIITSLLPSKILFGKSIPEFFKSKF